MFASWQIHFGVLHASTWGLMVVSFSNSLPFQWRWQISFRFIWTVPFSPLSRLLIAFCLPLALSWVHLIYRFSFDPFSVFCLCILILLSWIKHRSSIVHFVLRFLIRFLSHFDSITDVGFFCLCKGIVCCFVYFCCLFLFCWLVCFKHSILFSIGRLRIETVSFLPKMKLLNQYISFALFGWYYLWLLDWHCSDPAEQPW